MLYTCVWVEGGYHMGITLKLLLKIPQIFQHHKELLKPSSETE